MIRKGTDRVFAFGALLLIAVVWVVSAVGLRADLMPIVRQTVPQANHIVKQDNGLFSAWTDETETELIARIAIGTADGYGGPLQVAVAVDGSGELISAVIADEKETPAWMALVQKSGLMPSLVGKSYGDEFKLGEDVDVVTGATYTVRALTEAAAKGSRSVAEVLRRTARRQSASALRLRQRRILGVSVGLSSAFRP